MSKRQKGTEGETAALTFLKQKGYQILETNWRYQKYEVDILACKNNELVVVEVKLRSTDWFGDPEQFVSTQKQQYLIHAAEAYLDIKPEFHSTRFDVIAILDTAVGKKIKHLKGAFYPEIED